MHQRAQATAHLDFCQHSVSGGGQLALSGTSRNNPQSKSNSMRAARVTSSTGGSAASRASKKTNSSASTALAILLCSRVILCGHALFVACTAAAGCCWRGRRNVATGGRRGGESCDVQKADVNGWRGVGVVVVWLGGEGFCRRNRIRLSNMTHALF